MHLKGGEQQDQMFESLHEQTGDVDLKPDVVSVM